MQIKARVIQKAYCATKLGIVREVTFLMRFTVDPDGFSASKIVFIVTEEEFDALEVEKTYTLTDIGLPKIVEPEGEPVTKLRGEVVNPEPGTACHWGDACVFPLGHPGLHSFETDERPTDAPPAPEPEDAREANEDARTKLGFSEDENGNLVPLELPA